MVAFRPEVTAARVAYTVVEFCEAHRISRATFYNLLKLGHAPRIMRIGTRTLISAEAARDWRLEREAAAK